MFHQGFERPAFHNRSALGGMPDKGRFAPFSPEGYRGQIRAIRFHHEPVGRRGSKCVANVFTVLESEDPCEADQAIEFHQGFHTPGCTGETMKYRT